MHIYSFFCEKGKNKTWDKAIISSPPGDNEATAFSLPAALFLACLGNYPRNVIVKFLTL